MFTSYRFCPQIRQITQIFTRGVCNLFLFFLLPLIFIACFSGNEVMVEKTAVPPTPIQTGLLNQTLTHDGLEREYLLYVPTSYTGETAVPLLFNFHGYTSNANSQLGYADFRSMADREGFLLVYPQGERLRGGSTHWNVGGWTNGSSVDDVGFTEAMIDALAAAYSVDLGRVYSTGHSNGGYMSFLLACQLSGKITAVASVSGAMTPETFAECNPERPVPVLQIHGSADPVVPYDGASWTFSIDEVIGYWANHNECNAIPDVAYLPNSPDTTSDTALEQIGYEQCATGAAVAHIKYIDGGHEWLGTSDNAGHRNADIDTNEQIWAFLSQFEQ